MENKNKNNDVYLAKWLSGELSNQELISIVGKKEFDAFQKIKRGIEVFEGLEKSSDKTYESIEKSLKPKTKKTVPLFAKWTVGIAASILIIFGVLNFFDKAISVTKTGFGQHELVLLEDGSEVIVNSKSELTFNKETWENLRYINLDGEAYFKVSSGKTFTVMTPNGRVQVLGTEFNVKTTGDFFEVVCYEGKVKVTTEDGFEYILLPTNAIRKINGNQTNVFISKEFEPSWINGETTFSSVPVHIAIEALENEYNITIDASDIDKMILYSGAFPHDNLELALQIVFQPLSINYEFLDKNNIKLSNSK